MNDVKEWVAMLIMASLAAGLIVRLDKTTNFVDTVLTDFNGISKTLSGQLGANAISK